MVAKLTPTLGHVWSKTFGNSSNSQLGTAITIDPSGNVALTGTMGGSVSFGGAPVVGPSQRSAAFIAKLDPDGGFLTASAWGDNNQNSNTYGIAAAPSPDFFLAGEFQGVLDFGQGPMTADPEAGSDTFLVRETP